MADAPIDFDLLCCRCGYNLRTRTAADLCSDCGLPIQQSILFHRNQPSLAFGARRFALATRLMIFLTVASFLVNAYILLLPFFIARVTGSVFYNPLLALVRAVFPIVSIVIYAIAGASGLGPPFLRGGKPHANMFILLVIAFTFFSLAASALLLMQTPLGIRPTLFTMEARYVVYMFASLVSLWLDVYVFLFLRALTRRPEFASLNFFTSLIFVTAVISLTISTIESAYVLWVYFSDTPPNPALLTLFRIVDAVRLVAALATIAYWILFDLQVRRVARALAPVPAAAHMPQAPPSDIR